MSRKTLAVAAALAATALLLSACDSGGGDGSAEGDADRPLRIAAATDASSLDPIRGNSAADQQLLFPIYDTLISYNSDLIPEPGLVESWELPSPTELQLNLREGVTFHDGTDFDAEAVKYNIERGQAEDSLVAPELAAIDEVRIDDELTATLVLSRPDASLLMSLADRAGMMVSPTAAEEAGGDLSTDPVGAGGWAFSEWRRGEILRVERFEEYWDESAVRASEISFSILTEPQTRANSLIGGQQDIALDIATPHADLVREADAVSLFESVRLVSNVVFLNPASDAVSDPRVRRALALSVDREALLESGFFGFGEPARGIYPDVYWAGPPESVGYGLNRDEARRLLTEAGAEGLTFDLVAIANAQTTRIAEILKEQWAEVGVTVEIIPREVVQMNQEFFVEGVHPAALTQFIPHPDPAMTYALAFGSAGFFNPAKIAAPGLEEALAEQNQFSEIDDRKDGLDRAAEALYDFTPVVPITASVALVGLSDEVSGFELSLLGKPKFVGVTL